MRDVIVPLDDAQVLSASVAWYASVGSSALAIGGAAGAAAVAGAPLLLAGGYLQHEMMGTPEGLRARIASRRDRLAEHDQLIDLEKSGGADLAVQRLEKERTAMQGQLDALLQRLERVLGDFGSKPLNVSVDVNLDGQTITSTVNEQNARTARRE